MMAYKQVFLTTVFIWVIVAVFAACDTVVEDFKTPDSVTITALDVRDIRGSLIDNVRFWHDDERKVSCWLFRINGISCIPDYLLTQSEEAR